MNTRNLHIIIPLILYHYSGEECQSGAIQLVNGSNNMEGRIEICSRGFRGSVCGWHYGTTAQEYVKVFTNSEASVVCRQLGFGFEGMNLNNMSR